MAEKQIKTIGVEQITRFPIIMQAMKGSLEMEE